MFPNLMTIKRVTYFALFCAFLSWTNAQAFATTKALLEIVESFQGTLDTLDSALNVLEPLAQDREKAREFDPEDFWDALSARLLSTARRLGDESLVISFDSSAYAVGAEELSQCQTQGPSLIRLEELLEELSAATSRGQEASTRLEELKTTALNINERLEQLKGHMATLNVVLAPVEGSSWTTFMAQWEAIENRALPAVGDVLNEVQNSQKTLSQGMQEAVTRERNLRSNLELIREGGCLLETTLQGSCSYAGDNDPFPTSISFYSENGTQRAFVTDQEGNVTRPLAEIRLKGDGAASYVVMDQGGSGQIRFNGVFLFGFQTLIAKSNIGGDQFGCTFTK